MEPETTNKLTITYKRILNLGNYESKHLEITDFVDVSEDLEIATSNLMKFVERKIREDSEQEIKAEIKEAKKQLKELKKQIAECEDKLPTPDDLSIDDIPFDSGSGIPRPAKVNSEISDPDPDPLRHFCSPSEIPQPPIVNSDKHKRDWNLKIPSSNDVDAF